MTTYDTVPSIRQSPSNRPMAISTITSPLSASFAENDESTRTNSRQTVTPQPTPTYRTAEHEPSASSSLSSSPAESYSPFLAHVNTSPRSYSSTLSSPVFPTTTAEYSNNSSLLMMTTPPPQQFYAVSSEISVAPLSVQERRQRNKAASAKYRAKKNQQHGEMRGIIASLTRENELLQRQLDHVARENCTLKATCDRLRGKMLAERMLQRMLKDGNKKVKDRPRHSPRESAEDADLEEDMDDVL